MEVLGFQGLKREQRERAEAGDIVCVTGIEDLRISDTLCDPAQPEALPSLSVDEPTVSMTFEAPDSPFAGREGKFVTSRQIIERLNASSFITSRCAWKTPATRSACWCRAAANCICRFSSKTCAAKGLRSASAARRSSSRTSMVSPTSLSSS